MPIYNYQCPSCKKTEEAILPIKDMDKARECVCGAFMKRLMTLPQPAVFKQTINDRVLGQLNTKGWESNHKNPQKVAADVMRGFERNRPLQFTGVSI